MSADGEPVSTEFDCRIDSVTELEIRKATSSLTSSFHPLVAREVIVALMGIKVSRICLDSKSAARLLEHARRFRFTARSSNRKVVHRMDVGKGGWSNTLGTVLPLNAEGGDFEFYVAREDGLAMEALEADERHDDGALGRLLGIPECCRCAYTERALIACRKQNDFVPLVTAATDWPPPFDPSTNYLAQYFGQSLLSHFPCSFRCVATNRLADQIYSALAEVDSCFADKMRAAQRSNILYTEYSGIVLFRNTCVERSADGVTLSYSGADIEATAESPVVSALRLGNRLVAPAYNNIEVCYGSSLVARLYGEDFALCLFQ